MLAGGLRGVQIVSARPPFLARHIHPRELQFLLGFPPFQLCHHDCRAALCLLGNAVSPIEVVWILAQIWKNFGLSEDTPETWLRHYMSTLLSQQALSWPSVSPAEFLVRINCEQGCFEVKCNRDSTVAQLTLAHAVFEQSSHAFGLRWCVFDLPGFVSLKPICYDLVDQPLVTLPSVCPLHVILSFHGHVKHVIGPVGMSVAHFLQWQGVSEWTSLSLWTGEHVASTDRIFGGMHLVVHTCPEALALDIAMIESQLSLDLTGFGADTPEALQCPQSWGGQDLWHVDHVVRNFLLTSWAALGYPRLTVWIPTFADAVLELWPSMLESQLRAWLSVPSHTIFAILLETWGWNLVSFRLEGLCLTTGFFEPQGGVSEAASRLASRVRWSSDRAWYTETFLESDEVEPDRGSLLRVLTLIESTLGAPPCVSEALQLSRVDVPILGPVSTDGNAVSPTISMSATDQMPFPPGQVSQSTKRSGLAAPFLLDFARALVSSNPLSVMNDQVRVICTDPNQPEIGISRTQQFVPSSDPLFVFLLHEAHWTFVQCSLLQGELHITQYDGLHKDDFACLRVLRNALTEAWKPFNTRICCTWIIEQHRSDSCGTIALAHFALVLGLISQEQAKIFEHLHPSFAVCSRLVHEPSGLIGFGSPEDEAIVASLEQILPAKGVPPNKVRERALAAIKTLGSQPLQKALEAKNVWASLKGLGSARPKPFMWITHSELQDHIQARATTRFGVDVDQPRPKGSKQRKSAPAVSALLDPSSLNIMPGVFVANDGTSVDQIPLTGVQKNARGVAFASIAEAKPFLTEGKFISTEALAILVVGSLPPDVAHSLPAHAVRVPAIYQGTQEPVLADCTAIQLGDQAVYGKQNARVKEIAVYPTVVFRAHIFQDLWSEEQDWKEFQTRPLKSLTTAFPILNLCRDDHCDRSCGQFHPSLEEEGVEAAILDTWGFHWHTFDGQKTTPAKAMVLSFYLRVLESNFNAVHLSSGQFGVFYEPRKSDGPGPDPTYSILWLPQLSLRECLHRVRTNDQLITVCRLGHKFGVRCLSKNEKQVHQALCPGKPYVKCDVKEIFRLEPLPAGLQRQSLVEMLQDFAWNAKPLQQCKGSQGHAWLVGAAGPPPAPFFQAKHGWITISKVKDATPKVPEQTLIATTKTRQHIRDGSNLPPASSSEDPWHVTGKDPWGSYVGVTQPPPPVATHVQSKIEDVEQRLQESLTTHLDAALTS